MPPKICSVSSAQVQAASCAFAARKSSYYWCIIETKRKTNWGTMNYSNRRRKIDLIVRVCIPRSKLFRWRTRGGNPGRPCPVCRSPCRRDSKRRIQRRDETLDRSVSRSRRVYPMESKKRSSLELSSDAQVLLPSTVQYMCSGARTSVMYWLIVRRAIFSWIVPYCSIFLPNWTLEVACSTCITFTVTLWPFTYSIYD